MKKYFLLISFLVLAQISFAQKNKSNGKNVTIADIWLNYLFFGNSVDGYNPLNDGKTYSVIVDDGDGKTSNLVACSYQTGNRVDTLLLGKWLVPVDSTHAIDFSSYSLSDDEQQILIPTQTTRIFRHSSVSYYFIYNRKTKKTIPVSANGKQRDVTFSPDGNKVAFCRDNNLFMVDLKTGTEKQLTTNGEKNKIINGYCDWVYEEEFSFTRAYQWSPDSKKIAFIRFDESLVPEYTIQFFNADSLYPKNYTYKYPKVGERNSQVAVFVYDLDSSKAALVDIGNDLEQYIPRMIWTNDANKLCVTRMNRLQNHLDLLIADCSKTVWTHSPDARYKAPGFINTTVLFSEDNKRYIDITDNLTFLKNGNFIWTSEADGWNHIYLYDANGKLINQVTKGNWEVTSFYGCDEKNNYIYYQSNEKSPLVKNIYRIKTDGTGTELLDRGTGTNHAEFSKNYTYFMHTWSDANTPETYSISATGAGDARFLETNEDLIKLVNSYSHSKKTFFTCPAADGVTQLNGWMMLPTNFNKKKKYPVYMYQYSGPGSQEVNDSWDGLDYMYYTYLNEHGYIVACVDGRGTGGRGEEFKKQTFLKLGQLEVDDQIAAAKYLGALAYVDKNRIGIMGWSYGGYMSSLCIAKGADVFKMAIAVAPVVDWRFYDSIYTERYMQTNKTNKSGYDIGSPINYADKIEGNFMLVHGLADDNVHYQNSATYLNALYKNNIKFTQYTFPNKNHGIGGGNTRYYLFSRMAEFILTNL